MSGFLLGTDQGLRQIREPTVDVLTAGVGFTAGSSTTITLSADPGTENSVTISFDGITQHHDTYSQSGTTITFDAAIPTGVAKIEAIFVVSVLSYQRVQDDGVTSAKIADDQIDSEHYVDGSIDEAHIANDAVNFATHLKAGTDGELITWDASGNPAAVAVGTATHVLTSNGAGAAPTFQAAGGGGWEFVQTVTASTSSTIDIGTNNIDSGYDYMIVANNIDNSADLTVANSPIIQYGTGGTPTYQTSGYLSRYIFGRTTITGSAVGPTTGIPMATSNNIGGAAAGEIWSAEMVIPDPAANAISIARANAGMYSDAGSSDISITTGWRTTAEVITGFRITPGTGTFITGDFTLYKRANA